MRINESLPIELRNKSDNKNHPLTAIMQWEGGIVCISNNKENVTSKNSNSQSLRKH